MFSFRYICLFYFLLSCKCKGVKSDHIFLVGGNNEGSYLCAGSGELCECSFRSIHIHLLVDLDAEVGHIAAYVLTEYLIVLADTRGKYEGVNTVELSYVRADDLLDVVGEDLESESRSVIATVCRSGDISAVAGYTGYAEQTGLGVKELLNLGCGESFLLHNIRNNGRVDRAASCTHGHTVIGSEAHRGVNRLAARGSGDGGAVAKVTGDDLGILVADELCYLTADKSVGSTVEAVTTDLILFVKLVRKGVYKRLLFHRRIIRGVKYTYVSYVRHYSLTTLEAADCGRAVKGVDLNDALKICELLIVENRGLTDLSAVSKSVSYSADLISTCYNTELGVCEECKNELDRRLVILKLGFLLVVLLAGTLVSDDTVDADSLAKAFASTSPVSISKS